MLFSLCILPIVLLLIGFPIFLVLLSAVAVTLVFFMNVPLAALHQNLFGAINATPILAVPFFIYAGELMGRGSVAQRLVDFVQGGLGSVRGSLGVTTVGAASIFGAISGVSAATVATIGRVMYPSMLRAGYPESFAAGLVTAVGAIDIIIPPSIPMIVYGAAAEESVPRLYAAGIFPGLLLALMLTAFVMWRAWRGGFGKGEPFDPRAFWRGTRRGLWALGAPFIILGGIYGGVFSPTESAAVAAVYAALVTRFVFRELSFKDILDCAASTVFFTAQVLIIVACAGVFSWLLTVNQVPATLVAMLKGADVAAWQFLLAHRESARHRHGALRHHRHGQPRDRPLSSAVRDQHFRGPDRAGRRCHENLQGHCAVPFHLSHCARHHHLRASGVAPRREVAGRALISPGCAPQIGAFLPWG
jgi:C4-dicarboxylate transporter DctM subunit